MKREYNCIVCGKECIDNYPDLNEENKRQWCNECISKGFPREDEDENKKSKI